MLTQLRTMYLMDGYHRTTFHLNFLLSWHHLGRLVNISRESQLHFITTEERDHVRAPLDTNNTILNSHVFLLQK